MRLFTLFLLLALLPGTLLAQIQLLHVFKPGSYVEAKEPTVRIEGELELTSGTKLMVRKPDGTKLKFDPSRIISFRIGIKEYITTQGKFDYTVRLIPYHVEKAFVELMESGQIMLMNYAYNVATAVPTGGGMTMATGSYGESVYLLSTADDIDSLTPIPSTFFRGKAKKFHEVIAPYIVNRPDLQKLVDDQKIDFRNLRFLVRSLNSGKPFDGPFPKPPAPEAY